MTVTDQNNAAPEGGLTAELQLTDNMRVALDHAFDDARHCLADDGGMMPFSIICTSDGFVVSDHPGDDVDEVYESARTLVAQEMPEAYVLAYDGFVDLDDGRHDAILAEVGRRGEKTAYLLAQPYTEDEEAYEFAPTYASAGTAKSLYPRGTKPIVSGLVQLEAEKQAARDAAAAEDAPTRHPERTADAVSPSRHPERTDGTASPSCHPERSAEGAESKDLPADAAPVSASGKE